MSFVRCRGVPCEPLGGLGILGVRSVGCRGLPDSFPYHPFPLSGSDTPSQLFPQLHLGDCVGRCSGGSAREWSSRASSFGSGLLQSPLCHPQGHRGLEARDRPLTPKPVGSCLPVSHGDSFVGSPISSSGRLDGVPGYPGCLHSGSGAPVISALPEVLHGGFGPTVSRSLFRPVDCPAGVHAGHGSCVCHHAPVRFQDPTLPGRLACPWILVSGYSAGEGLPPLALPGARGSCEPLQELSGSGSDFGLSGDEASNASFEGFPDPKACPEALLSLLLEFVSCPQQLLTLWRQLLGVMSSLSSIVPGSRLRMHSLQLCLNTAGHLLPYSASVSWDNSCLEDLRWWSEESYLSVVLPLDLPQPDLALYTDASDLGWGAFLQDDHLSGLWSRSCLTFSINYRELLAVFYGVQGFLPVLRVRSVSLFADNTTALSYLQKQWGTHSATLNSVAQSILRLCELHQIRLVPQFIPDKLNVLADSLSRRSQVLSSEWTLCHQAFRELLRRWPATIDLFATSMNARLPVYFAPMADPQSAGMDAMMQSWDGMQAYAFPPFGLLHRVLSKVRQSRGLKLTLVASFWPQHPWFPDLLELLVAVPVFLPQTAALPSLSPEPPRASADCVSYLERSARAFGFTLAVARQLARCRRTSTPVNYQAKWSVFRAWCHRHGHSVSHPTIPKIASFLLYLRRSLSLSYSSIASYCSMLSGVFRFVLPDLSSYFVLRDLLRSFRPERPLSSSRAPPWDLSRVLSFLRGTPFEPLSSCSLWDLSHKVLFLVALATARRVGGASGCFGCGLLSLATTSFFVLSSGVSG